MNILPRGVTGFHLITEEAPPNVDEGSFKAYCYQLARATHARVELEDKGSVQYRRNYHAAFLILRSRRYLVMCNAHYPLIGLSLDYDESGALSFCELSHELDEVNFGGFELLSAALLNSPVDRGHCRDLSSAELDQIAYWEPRSLGALIYHHWA